jgi:hypothetical protein
MGAGVTKPQVISRQALLRNTAGAQKLINDMFEVMRTKLTPEDFLKLGNPSQCKTFVFMMADSIQNMFTALRIRPRRAGDSGVVFFEEADALRTQNPETKQLCLIIAYFYIRIFQIFGALAITVLDDPSAGPVLAATRLGEPGIAGIAGQQPAGLFGRKLPGIQIGPGIPLGVRPARPAAAPGIPGRPLMRGGYEEEDHQEGGADSGYFTGPAQQFYQLRELFDNPQVLPAGKKQLRMFPFRDNANFLLIPGRQHESRNQNLKLTLDQDRAIYAQMTASKIGLLPDILHFKITLSNFLYKDAAIADRFALSKINLQLRSYKEELQIYSDDRGKTWRSDKSRLSVVEELDQTAGRVQEIVRQLETNPEMKLQDVAAVKKRAVAAVAVPGQQRPYGAAGQPVSRGDVFVPKALQNEYIINTLKSIGTNRPVAFCVARALQLIDAPSLFSSQIKTAVSGVCFGSFQSRPASAPEVGKTLDKMTGLRMLDQLFYTAPYIEQDKSQIGVDKEDTAAYADFLKEMAGLFGRPGAGQTGIDRIQVTENPGCVADAAKKYLNITDPKAIAAIMKIVGQLFSRQLAHTKRVLAFYNSRLFQIIRVKNPSGGIDLTYRLHPKIMGGGLPELAKISKEARDILVDYYEGCEKTYQEGVKLVLQARVR